MSLQFALAVRYLWGRKTRTLLTTLAVIFGVMVIFGLNGMLPGMLSTFRLNMLAAAGEVDLAITSVTGGDFDAGIVQTVRDVPGIAQATQSLRQNVALPSGAAINAVTVTGIDPKTAREARPYVVVQGRFLEPDDGNVMLVSEKLAREGNLGVGSTLRLPAVSGSTELTVVGVLSVRALPGVEEVYVPLPAAQALFGLTGKINTIEAVFSPGTDHATVEAAVTAVLGSGFKLGALESGSELMSSLKLGEVAFNLFGVLALVMGGFIIFNTFRTVVAERRHDLGMLRAVGASRRTILGSILMESLLQGIVGAGLGILVGGLLSVGLLRMASPVVEKYLHYPLGNPIFAPSLYAISVALGVGVTVLSGLYPAIAASHVTPLEAMRPSLAEVRPLHLNARTLVGSALMTLALGTLLQRGVSLTSLGAVLFVLGLILVAPALISPIAVVFGRLLAVFFAREGEIAQGNLKRHPERSTITASAMMIGFAIVVALAGLTSSLYNGFMSYVDKSMGADYLFVPPSLVLAGGNVGAGPELLQTLRKIPDVASVSSLRIGKTVIKGMPVQAVGIDPVSYPQVSGLIFSQGDERTTYADLAAGRNVVANGIFASQNSVHVGDVLNLETLSGSVPYRVVAIAFDYLNAKLATVYISQQNLATDLGGSGDVLLMASLAPGGDEAAVRVALADAIKPYSGFSLIEAAPWRKAQREAFTGAMSLLVLLLAALAAPSLIALTNTLAINVIERTREIGMIRAVGGTQRQIGRMVLAESLLLSATGVAFGILSGLWLGYVLVGAMNVAGFLMRYYFPYTGILLTVALGMLFGVGAAVLPARQAAKLDIVTALHFE